MPTVSRPYFSICPVIRNPLTFPAPPQSIVKGYQHRPDKALTLSSLFLPSVISPVCQLKLGGAWNRQAVSQNYSHNDYINVSSVKTLTCQTNSEQAKSLKREGGETISRMQCVLLHYSSLYNNTNFAQFSPIKPAIPLMFPAVIYLIPVSGSADTPGRERAQEVTKFSQALPT